MSNGFAAIGERVRIDPTARFYGAERIEIGSDVRIDAYTVISAGAGGIAIGNHVHIAAFAFVAGAAHIELADFSGLSGQTAIYSSSDDYGGASLTNPTVPAAFRRVHSAPVRVGRHVVVGAGSIVLPGVTLADGSAVGALSLVKDDVEALALVAGVPARRIGSRSDDLFRLEDELRGYDAS